MNEMKVQGWVARDENGALWLYADNKPYKKATQGDWVSNGYQFFEIEDRNLFPEVEWEDKEPTEVEITIKPKGDKK